MAPPVTFPEPIDSRRLTGPNLVWNEPGAVLDVQFDASAAVAARSQGIDPAQLVERWKEAARELLDAVDWRQERTRVLWHEGHREGAAVSLAISAPMDGLYSATELNEAAWDFACRRAAADPPSAEEVAAKVTEVRASIRAEHDPELRALREEAARRGVRCIVDDEHLSLGAGRGSRTWQCSGPYAEHEEPVSEPLPEPGEVPWEELHDIPIALITGTNGKTTTTRLLAAMARAAGKTVAMCSTEGVWCGGTLIDAGDYSGPGGARLALRQKEADIALLETARGGMLRRGLGVTHADVALITNVAEDHLGEFGIADLEGLARVKAIVARAVEHLVLNWDDPQLRALAERQSARAARSSSVSNSTSHSDSDPYSDADSEISGEVELPSDVQWFSIEENPIELAARHRTRCAGVIDESLAVVSPSGEVTELAKIADVPLTFGGAAHYNVANALAASLVARQLGLADDAIRQALHTFGSDPRDNPGRGNLFQLGTARVLADFAHNPHGVEAALDLVRGLEPSRLVVVIGQAGDRDDVSIAGLGQAVARRDPDLVLVKKLTEYSRGREPGAVAEMLATELRRGGVEPPKIEIVEDEPAALAALQNHLRAGDVALFTVHSHRQATLDALRDLESSGWAPSADS